MYLLKRIIDKQQFTSLNKFGTNQFVSLDYIFWYRRAIISRTVNVGGNYQSYKTSVSLSQLIF